MGCGTKKVQTTALEEQIQSKVRTEQIELNSNYELFNVKIKNFAL